MESWFRSRTASARGRLEHVGAEGRLEPVMSVAPLAAVERDIIKKERRHPRHSVGRISRGMYSTHGVFGIHIIEENL